MGSLKEMLKSLEDEEESQENELEVYADSLKQALELASKELRVEISMLDYNIVEKGVKGFLGMGRQPYKVMVKASKTHDAYKDIDDIERKLAKISVSDLEIKDVNRYQDGKFKVRVTKSGVWLTVTGPTGGGQPVNINDINTRLFALRINEPNTKRIEKEIKSPSNKPVRVGEWTPNPELDGTLSIEVAEDEMRVYAHFVHPKFGGRHMEVDDVLESLKRSGVVSGINEARVAGYLEEMDYSRPLLAAEGQAPRHGKDAYIDYKVRIDKADVSFSEDEKGQVDFKNLDLLENVVVGQLLAVKVPAEQGVPGRSVTNRIMPARSGKDTVLRHGKGTILSEDGTELTAEINGQVVFQAGRISVEPVYYVKGDVSLETGNIVFLGSVVVGGSVQDNFIVKAAGNIEVKGSVQKAFLEAEGDIVVRQGIMGREEAKIESTGGSIYANFIQSTNAFAERDVIVSEGILHSRVDAAGRILCHGRRARIVGGVLRAGDEVNARVIGSDSFTKTEVRTGINPKVLQQITDLEAVKAQVIEELDKLKKDTITLSAQKTSAGGKLPADKEEMLGKMLQQRKKTEDRLSEVTIELEELKAYLTMLDQKGKVCAEQTIFPGVEIFIKDKRFPVRDPYNHIKFALEGGEIRLSEYEKPDLSPEDAKKSIIRRRR